MSENKPDIGLLRDCWSECWGASQRNGYSIDKMQKSFEDWLDSRHIEWREIEAHPVLVGHLNREYGYYHCDITKKGTEVYEFEGRYFFWVQPDNADAPKFQQRFYKDDLEKHIDFIDFHTKPVEQDSWPGVDTSPGWFTLEMRRTAREIWDSHVSVNDHLRSQAIKYIQRMAKNAGYTIDLKKTKELFDLYC